MLGRCAIKFAYADPPYLGWANSFYKDEHTEASSYDNPQTHIDLVEMLLNTYPDGWALSCHTAALSFYLPLMPENTRVCAWTKTMFNIRNNVTVNYSWEPVLLYGGRPEKDRRPFVKDTCVGPRARTQGLRGSKPPYFNDWILDLLNYKPGDQLDDLFPGTNGMAQAVFRKNSELSLVKEIWVQM
jgi:hypothetical protein